MHPGDSGTCQFTPFNNREGTPGFKKNHIETHYSLCGRCRGTASQCASIWFQYQHCRTIENIGQPYVGVDTPTSSLTHLVAARVFMCTVRPFVIFSESLVLVTQTLDNYLACFASCICLKPSCISLARSNLASINLANCSAVNTCSLSGCNFSSLFSFIYP